MRRKRHESAIGIVTWEGPPHKAILLLIADRCSRACAVTARRSQESRYFLIQLSPMLLSSRPQEIGDLCGITSVYDDAYGAFMALPPHTSTREALSSDVVRSTRGLDLILVQLMRCAGKLISSIGDT
jgi:hypothetical protein